MNRKESDMEEPILRKIQRLEKRYNQKLDKIVTLDPGIEYEYHKRRVLECEKDRIWEELDGLLNSVGSSAWDYVVMGNKNL
jgi:hypothetical protein